MSPEKPESERPQSPSDEPVKAPSAALDSPPSSLAGAAPVEASGSLAQSSEAPKGNTSDPVATSTGTPTNDTHAEPAAEGTNEPKDGPAPTSTRDDSEGKTAVAAETAEDATAIKSETEPTSATKSKTEPTSATKSKTEPTSATKSEPKAAAPAKVGGERGLFAGVSAAVSFITTRSRKLDEKLVRFDPNTDETADPLSAISVFCLFVTIAFSVWMFLRWKYQPMQDLGHHVALSAVVADYGKPESLYTRLYEPIDPLAANSLLYQLAGNLGRLVGVTRAVRLFMVLYLAGVPLANAYALRVFGRNVWGAVVAVPLTYNMVFVAGFANMLFAAPLMVMAIPLLHLAIKLRSWRRALVAALTILLLFMGHAHLFMWTGFMLFLLTFGHVVYGFTQGPGFKKRIVHAAKSAGIAFLCVVPTLLFFARWYSRTFGEGRAQGNVMNSTSGIENHFGAVFRGPHELFATLVDTFELTIGDRDVQGVLLLGLLAGIMFAISRLSRLRQPPVLELVFVITMMSYFVLPDGLSGHDVLAQRQPSIAFWFVPALFTPVAMRVSRLLRFVSVVGIGAVTVFMLSSWYDNLVLFQKNEVAGLEQVMSKAPPRQRLHYVKLDPGSRYFSWRPFWHIEKIYMGDKLGQTADTPGILSTSSIRYRTGVDIHRIGNHSPDWPNDAEIWKNFELVLVRSWHPSTEQRVAAERHGVLLQRSGAWELWKSNEATPP